MSEVTSDDIKKKLQQIQDQVDDTSKAAKPAGIAVGLAVASATVGIAFIIGQRKAKRQSVVVEVKRV